MTTAVTIDAHAGWPVLVVEIIGESQHNKSVRRTIVPPGTKNTFYIHSGNRIADIVELPVDQTEERLHND